MLDLIKQLEESMDSQIKNLKDQGTVVEFTITVPEGFNIFLPNNKTHKVEVKLIKQKVHFIGEFNCTDFVQTRDKISYFLSGVEVSNLLCK